MQNMDNRIKEVTGAILNDYSQGRYIDKENNFSQPEKEAVVDIIEKLQKMREEVGLAPMDMKEA